MVKARGRPLTRYRGVSSNLTHAPIGGDKMIWFYYNKPSSLTGGWRAWLISWYSFPKSTLEMGGNNRYRGLRIFGIEISNYEEKRRQNV